MPTKTLSVQVTVSGTDVTLKLSAADFKALFAPVVAPAPVPAPVPTPAPVPPPAPTPPPPVVTLPPPPPPAVTWATLCNERDPFTLATPAMLRYGIEPNWTLKYLTAGSYTASNTLFGADPVPGAQKQVQARSTPPTAAESRPAVVSGLKLTKVNFGLQVVYAADTDQHYELGYGALRIHGGAFTWRRLEVSPGVYVWARLDAALTGARAADARVIVTLGQAPPFRTGGVAGGPSGAGSDYNSTPVSVQDYSDYLTAIGNRVLSVYGQGAIWELWNEVDPDGATGGNFWQGQISTLVEYARVAKAILKKIDPTCVILTPSVTGSVSYVNPALEQMFAAGIGQYVDGVAIHGYVTPEQPEAVIPYLENYRAQLVRYGYSHLPIYDPESTWASYRETPDGPERTLTGGYVMGDQQRAAYVLRHWLSGLAAGFTVQSHYAAEYDAPGPGADNFKTLALWDGNGKLNAGGIAMKTFISLMVGATVQGYQNGPGGVYALSVLMADGTPAVWLWCGDSVAVPFPQAIAAGLAFRTDFTGARTAVGSAESIGSVPALYLAGSTVLAALELTRLLGL